MARKRTDDDSVTYWFFWKHRTANAPVANFSHPSTSASRSRTCCVRLRPRWVWRSNGIDSVLMVLHYQLLGIGVTHEMRNISRYIEQIFTTLSGFLANSIPRPTAKQLPKFCVRSLGWGWGNFFSIPNISPNSGLRGLKFFGPWDI